MKGSGVSGMNDSINICDYAEKILGVKLMQTQKILLRELYELNKNGCKLVYMPSLRRFVVMPKEGAD